MHAQIDLDGNIVQLLPSHKDIKLVGSDGVALPAQILKTWTAEGLSEIGIAEIVDAPEPSHDPETQAISNEPAVIGGPPENKWVIADLSSEEMTIRQEKKQRDLEQTRKRTLRNIAKERINQHMLGADEDAINEHITQLLLTMTEVIDLLVSKGTIALTDLTPSTKQSHAKVVDVKQARQAVKQAIQNSDDIAAFEAALDLIIPPQA